VRSHRSRAVLVTGCSSGIGRATVELLLEREWPVYATARSPQSIEDLAARGANVLGLDMEDERSIEEAASHVEHREGAVGVVVNNAGYGLHGAIETTPLEDVRRQFETNFFGHVRLTQLLLPKMRAQGWGRIVNMSSMGGKIELPGGGFYHASKHALEAYSDVLRYEVRSFGIDVVVIEPGLIRTRFGEAAVATVEIQGRNGSPYADYNRGLSRVIAGGYSGGMARFSAPPEGVAKIVVRAIEARRPRARYPVTLGARAMLATRAVLPDRAWDALMRTQYPTP
jgi:NAD(P)-dependent dehydrogenase (short-subunit alcohol dehydrogenase family)